MGVFDAGVGTAFWLMLFSSLLCIVYGGMNWNKGAEEQVVQGTEEWAHDEDAINEEL